MAVTQRPRLMTPPKLTVENGLLVLDWPEGPKPEAIVISTKGYEALINQINFLHRRVANDQKVVAAARKVVAMMPKQEPGENPPT